MSPAAKGRTKTAPAASANVVGWREVEPAPVVLITGTEEFLATAAVDRLRSRLRTNQPDLDISRLDASTYTAGELTTMASPSLFGEFKLIEATELAAMNDAFLADALAYLDAVPPETMLLLQHGGGARGKKLLDAVKRSGAPVVECKPLKKDSEKLEFVRLEFRTAGRRIDQPAARALVDAVGSKLGELAAACSQLMADVDGTVSPDNVERYYGGRVEATAFKVADAALAGRGPVALSTLRHALATGVDPVPLVAALAMKVRTVAKVSSSRGSAAQLAKDLGMAPWQVEQARRDAARFSSEALARCITVLAEADAQVKGAAKDPVYAVERAVTVIATSGGRG